MNSTVEPSIIEINSIRELDFENVNDGVFDETTTETTRNYEKYMDLVDVAIDEFFYERSTDISSATEASKSTYGTVPSTRQTNFMSAVLDTAKIKPDLRSKVSRILIIKRPFRSSTKTETDSITESMVTISSAKEMDNYFELKYFETIFVNAAAKTIAQWKTSSMVLIILALISLLLATRRRRRIIRLKAEIVQKNLGTSYNQSCSYPLSTNAYTPTNFPRRQHTHTSKFLCRLSYSDSDYEPTAGSRSSFYAQTYNSSLHLYESIDEPCIENIYTEISTRKHSIVSIENMPNNNENNSMTSCKFNLK